MDKARLTEVEIYRVDYYKERAYNDGGWFPKLGIPNYELVAFVKELVRLI